MTIRMHHGISTVSHTMVYGYVPFGQFMYSLGLHPREYPQGTNPIHTQPPYTLEAHGITITYSTRYMYTLAIGDQT